MAFPPSSTAPPPPPPEHPRPHHPSALYPRIGQYSAHPIACRKPTFSPSSVSKSLSLSLCNIIYIWDFISEFVEFHVCLFSELFCSWNRHQSWFEPGVSGDTYGMNSNCVDYHLSKQIIVSSRLMTTQEASWLDDQLGSLQVLMYDIFVLICYSIVKSLLDWLIGVHFSRSITLGIVFLTLSYLHQILGECISFWSGSG